jgi:hypothetical protein
MRLGPADHHGRPDGSAEDDRDCWHETCSFGAVLVHIGAGIAIIARGETRA